MAAAHRKGSVVPLADSFSQANAELVAKHVQGAVAQLEQQVRELERFADENLTLSKLVRQLPDSVTHQVMVPFGKAAFFPGRLVHTNELMVLLGERYFAERSAKQTIQFLARRGEYLNSKLLGVKAQVADLQAEASFARAAAEEAAAGMVEIREEYQHPPRIEKLPKDGPAEDEPVVQDEEDEEHERLMARLAELELKEAAEVAEDLDDTDEESWEDQEDGDEDDNDDWIDQFLNPAVRKSLLPGRLAAEAVDDENSIHVFQPELREVPLDQQLGCGRPASQSAAGLSKGILASGDHGPKIAKPGRRVRFSDSVVEPKVIERLEDTTGSASLTNLADIQEYRRSGVGQPFNVTVPRHMENRENQDDRDAWVSRPAPVSGTPDPVPTPAPQRRFAPNSPFPGARRAFTGAVVEHVEGVSVEQSAEQRKRPVSRFRKQMEGAGGVSSAGQM